LKSAFQKRKHDDAQAEAAAHQARTLRLLINNIDYNSHKIIYCSAITFYLTLKDVEDFQAWKNGGEPW
jgi:hypothetical protein